MGLPNEVDRRLAADGSIDLGCLGMPQRLTLNTIEGFGFTPWFIRGEGGENLLVCRNGDSIATIDSYGKFNISPNIELRDRDR